MRKNRILNDLRKGNGFHTDWRGIFISRMSKQAQYLPKQGLKLHISFKDIEEYRNWYEFVVVALVRHNLIFKIVNPDSFMLRAFCDHPTQAGKFITIYSSQHGDWKGFEKDLYPFLHADGAIEVASEKHFYGRVYGRYGSFVGECVQSPTGEEIVDDRNVEKPFFIKNLRLEDFGRIRSYER